MARCFCVNAGDARHSSFLCLGGNRDLPSLFFPPLFRNLDFASHRTQLTCPPCSAKDSSCPPFVDPSSGPKSGPWLSPHVTSLLPTPAICCRLSERFPSAVGIGRQDYFLRSLFSSLRNTTNQQRSPPFSPISLGKTP